MSNISWIDLNWVDYLILVILFFSILISFFRGFVREAVSLVTWIAAFVLAFNFYIPFSDYLTPYIASETLRHTITFIGILLLILIIGLVINSLVKSLLHGSPVRGIDRVLGIFFGFVRGILLIAIILLFVNVTALKEQPALKASQLTPQFKGVLNWLHDFFPEQMNNLVLSKDPEQEVNLD